MRVGKFVEHFRAAAEASDAKGTDPLLKYCAVGRQLGYAGYLLLDNLTVVCSLLKLFQRIKSNWRFNVTVARRSRRTQVSCYRPSPTGSLQIVAFWPNIQHYRWLLHAIPSTAACSHSKQTRGRVGRGKQETGEGVECHAYPAHEWLMWHYGAPDKSRILCVWWWHSRLGWYSQFTVRHLHSMEENDMIWRNFEIVGS